MALRSVELKYILVISIMEYEDNMNDWDLIIYEDATKKSVQNRFQITDRRLDVIGQHGQSVILRDEQDEEWLLKIFENIIDFELKEIFNLDVDIEDTPDESRERMHLWRVLNELVASRLALRLGLNVPEAIVICSQSVAEFNLEPNTLLPLGNVVILDEEEGGIGGRNSQDRDHLVPQGDGVVRVG